MKRLRSKKVESKTIFYLLKEGNVFRKNLLLTDDCITSKGVALKTLKHRFFLDI